MLEIDDQVRLKNADVWTQQGSDIARDVRICDDPIDLVVCNGSSRNLVELCASEDLSRSAPVLRRGGSCQHERGDRGTERLARLHCLQPQAHATELGCHGVHVHPVEATADKIRGAAGNLLVQANLLGGRHPLGHNLGHNFLTTNLPVGSPLQVDYSFSFRSR